MGQVEQRVIPDDPDDGEGVDGGQRFPCFLVLEDGSTFPGFSFGHQVAKVTGEVGQ